MKLRLRAFSGPLVVLIWQTVPVGAPPDSVGRTRIWLGYGRGQFEDVYKYTSCEGVTTTDIDGIDYRTGGSRVDFWPRLNLRATGFVGRRTYGKNRALSGAYTGTVNPAPPDATYVGAEVALERQGFGIGLGVAHSPDHRPELGPDGRNRYTLPTMYLRFGDIDHAHLRTDLFAPGEAHRSLGEWRIGVESNTGHLRGPAWFTGAAFCHFCNDEGNIGVFGELFWPLQRNFGIAVRGLANSGETRAGWSFGTSVRANF